MPGSRNQNAARKRRKVPFFVVALLLALVYMAGAGILFTIASTPEWGLDAVRIWTIACFLALSLGVFLSIRRGRSGTRGGGAMSQGAAERFAVDLFRSVDPMSTVSAPRGRPAAPAQLRRREFPSLSPLEPIAARLELEPVPSESDPGFEGVLDGVPIRLRLAWIEGLCTQVHAMAAAALPAAVTISPEISCLRIVSLSPAARDVVATEEARARLESLADATLHAEGHGVTVQVPGLEEDEVRLQEMIVLALRTAQAIGAAAEAGPV